MSKNIFIQTPFSKIAAKNWNEGQKPLLALHGWMDNAASFDYLAPLLPHFETMAIDLPGHGLSEHRSVDSGYAFINWPLDVAACIHKLGWSKFTLLGHSLGASIACFVAALYPEAVERLILIEGIGPMTEGSDDPIATLQKHIRENLAFAEKNPPVYNNLDDLIVRRQKVGNISFEAAKLLIERCVEKNENGFTWRIDPRLRTTSPVRLTEEQVLASLAKIKCPVILFKATNGIPYDENKMAKRCDVISDLQIVEVPGSHHPHMDHPEQVAEKIMSQIN